MQRPRTLIAGYLSVVVRKKHSAIFLIDGAGSEKTTNEAPVERRSACVRTYSIPASPTQVEQWDSSTSRSRSYHPVALGATRSIHILSHLRRTPPRRVPLLQNTTRTTPPTVHCCHLREHPVCTSSIASKRSFQRVSNLREIYC